jgi:Leucine-rich repeat (LRR) protein
LSHLVDVDLGGNQIQNLSAFSSLPGLRSLELSGNQITDLAPLVANLALGHGTAVSITHNPPLDCAAQGGNIATLRARGVSLDTDCP